MIGLKYWHQTLKGLEALAWDAFDAVCVTAGEKALAWWDRQHPNAHHIDMSDMLNKVEEEIEVHEPSWFHSTPRSDALLEIERIRQALDGLEHIIETHLPSKESS